MSSAPDVAAVWVDQEDGRFKRGWCTYSELFSADIAKQKGREWKLCVYGSKQLGGAGETYPAELVYRANSKDMASAPDMTSLVHLEEPNMLECLELRYARNEIYTNIATVLVAVNPYKSLGIYSRDSMNKYRGNRRLDMLRPHIFAVAERAYRALMFRRENQSMICCGESGSGKTESTKMLMRYLANVTQLMAYNDDSLDSDADFENMLSSTSMVEEQVLQANPILEAFGNARTNMNDNSSRFAKFIKLLFSGSPDEMPKLGKEGGRILGANTETYLLERSRVSRVAKGERNYHVFYQISCAANDPTVRDACEAKIPQIEDPTFFRYLNMGDKLKLDGVSDSENFEELQSCMTTMGVNIDDQNNCFSALAGILYIGNVDFNSEIDDSKGGKDLIQPGSMGSVKEAASYLGVSTDKLVARLTTRTVRVRSESYAKPIPPDDAASNRDAISKALYATLFDWAVTSINQMLYRGNDDEEELNWIGILDVFGFECFDNNSFEQFCINFANEKLQNFFNIHILKSEQEEYRREGIFWEAIDIPDNSHVISLISGRPSGIVCLLDSACIMPKGSPQNFHQNLFTVHPRHKALRRSNVPQSQRAKSSGNKVPGPRSRSRRRSISGMFVGFEVSHFAGPVVYDCKDFLKKNSDSTHPDTIGLLANSSLPLLQNLFAADYEKQQKSSRGVRFQSIGSKFTRQLDVLMKLLQSTSPYFVRCANPNNKKKSDCFDAMYVRPQLRCGGLVEALRMLKCGYPSRVKYDVVYEQYGHALKPQPGNLNRRNFCEGVLLAFGLGRSQYQLGLTKVFFRSGKQEFLQSVFRRSKEPMTKEMELKVRKWLVKRRMDRFRGATVVFIHFKRRLDHIRAALAFRKGVRIAVIYCTTFKAALTKIRRKRYAQLYAVIEIQKFYRHNNRRKCLAKEIKKRILKRRQMKFAKPKVDEKTAAELRRMKEMYKKSKQQEEAEKRQLSAVQEEAKQKEAQMQKELEEKKRVVEELQTQLQSMKSVDDESKQQKEMIEQLRENTERLRRENEQAVENARMIVEQREKELAEKAAELQRQKEESEKRQKEAEEKAAALLKEKEEEESKRHAELEELRRATEELKEQQRLKAEEAQRKLQEQEELQKQKEEQLAKLMREQERLQASNTEMSKAYQEEKAQERLRMKEEQLQIQADIQKMKLDLERETMVAQAELSARERENQRREEELRQTREEAKKMQQDFHQMRIDLEEERRRERRENEEELRRMKDESEATKQFYEDQVNQQKKLLQEQEEENKKKEEVLARMAQEADELRRRHEEGLKEAQLRLQEQEEEAKNQMQMLQKSMEAAQQVYELKQKKIEEQAKQELASRLEEKDTENKSAMDVMRKEYETKIQQLQMLVVERDEEIELLNDEVVRLTQETGGEFDSFKTKLMESQKAVRERDLLIDDMKTEMESMQKAHAEVTSISERLLLEQQEEHDKKVKDMQKTIQLLKKKLQISGGAPAAKPGTNKGVSRFGFKRRQSITLDDIQGALPGSDKKIAEHRQKAEQKNARERKSSQTPVRKNTGIPRTGIPASGIGRPRTGTSVRSSTSSPALAPRGRTNTNSSARKRAPSRAAGPVRKSTLRQSASSNLDQQRTRTPSAPKPSNGKGKPSPEAVVEALKTFVKKNKGCMLGVPIKKTDKPNLFMFGSQQMPLALQGKELKVRVRKIGGSEWLTLDTFIQRFAGKEARKIKKADL